jgi:hypothetical protein
MIPIPGLVIAVLSFPGVIVHELGHLLFCRLRRIPVIDAKFFQLDTKAQGYVIHGPAPDYGSHLLVAAGPLILNTLLCLLICLPASLPFYVFDSRGPFTLFLLWLGVSIGMHAFPSTGDAASLWQATKAALKEGQPLAYLGLPLTGLIFIANILSFFWFDAIYGLAIGIGLPMLLFKAL